MYYFIYKYIKYNRETDLISDYKTFIIFDKIKLIAKKIINKNRKKI